MFFEDRRHAGELLAGRLSAYGGRSPLILAVPRGGVTVALPLWQSLGGDLDLIITRKIGAPGRPELAVGAVTVEGYVMLNEALAAQLHLPAGYVERISAEEQAEIKRRLQLYRGRRIRRNRWPARYLVDDGEYSVTLRATLQASNETSAETGPGRSVSPPDILDRLVKLTKSVILKRRHISLPWDGFTATSGRSATARS